MPLDGLANPNVPSVCTVIMQRLTQWRTGDDDSNVEKNVAHIVGKYILQKHLNGNFSSKIYKLPKMYAILLAHFITLLGMI